MVAASDFKVACGKPSAPRTRLMEKIGAAKAGYPADPSFQSPAMERGHEIEEVARDCFSFAHDVEVKKVGLATNSVYPGIGASLDGLIGDNIGWECKAPMPSILWRYQRANRLPPDYATQVYGQMLVCNLDGVWFHAYHPDCVEPSFEIFVPRDDEKMQAIAEGLDKFLADLAKLEGKR